MEKYDVLYEQLIYEGTITEEDVFSARCPFWETLFCTHSENIGIAQAASFRAMRSVPWAFPTHRFLLNGIYILLGVRFNARYALQGRSR